MEGDNTGTKADRLHAGGALHAKEEVGRGGGAHREWCSVGGQGDVEAEAWQAFRDVESPGRTQGNEAARCVWLARSKT